MTKQEAKAFINAFVKLRELATDEMSLQVPNLYPTWKIGVIYTKDERVLYNDILYKILLSHTSQEDWNPEVAPSLFAKVLIPDENTIYPWEQPDSTNTYKIGDKVTHNGKIWVSTENTNSWEPGVYGWEVTE